MSYLEEPHSEDVSFYNNVLKRVIELLGSEGGVEITPPGYPISGGNLKFTVTKSHSTGKTICFRSYGLDKDRDFEEYCQAIAEDIKKSV